MGNRIMITGLGFAHPGTLITTEEVCAYIGVPERAEKFETQFFMHTRPLRWENGAPKKVEWPGTTLAIEAARQALDMAGVSAEDVTYVVHVSCTPDVNHFQADVYRIIRELGATRASALSVNLGCGGIAPPLHLASVLLATGAAQHVLITTANSTSPFMVQREDYVRSKNWFSLAMFSDSAGAMLLSAVPDHRVAAPANLRLTVPHRPVYDGLNRPADELETFAHLFIADDTSAAPGLLSSLVMESGAEPLMHVTGGGANDPTTWDRLYSLHGGPVAQRYGPVMLETIELMQRHTPLYHPTTAKLTAVHQANGNVVAKLRRALHLADDDTRLPIRTWELGNCVSASTPEIVRDAVRNNRLVEGDIVALATIGAGMSTGGAVFRWGSA